MHICEISTFQNKMIKILKTDTTDAVPCPIAKNFDLASLRGIKTIGGVRLAGKFPPLTLQLDDGDESPSGLVDYFKVGLLHVVSSKLRAVLERVGAELEYLSVNVVYHGNPAMTDFFVANPLKRFNAIDMRNSDLTLDEELGDALVVRRLVIDETKFTETKLAVVAEIQKIGVQSEVALTVESSGCIGCVFVDPISFQY